MCTLFHTRNIRWGLFLRTYSNNMRVDGIYRDFDLNLVCAGLILKFSVGKLGYRSNWSVIIAEGTATGQ